MDLYTGYEMIGYAALAGLAVGFIIMMFRSSYRRGRAA